MKRAILILLAALLCAAGCTAEGTMTYLQISQEDPLFHTGTGMKRNGQSWSMP